MAIEGVPKEMLAVQVVEFNKPYTIHKVPTPTSLKPHEILLKTVVASLCHTDSMVVAGKFPTKLPCTASHEGTGIVVAVGDEVTNFKKGDRVMSGLPRNPCEKCFNCQGPNDWHQYCQHIEGHIGVFVDGAFSEYHVVDNRTSCHIPDNVSFASAAPLACAGCTIYRAIIVAEVPEGGWLGIVGAGGGLGHLGIQFAMAKGINVVAVDARDEGLELCKKAGAKHIFDAREGKEKVVEQVQKLTDGLGVHASINVSEHETSADMACAITRMHGTMVQTAQPDRVCVAFQELIFRDIRIKGTLIAGQEYSQQMLNDAGKHGIKVETNIFYGLEEVPKMVELAHSGKMKGKAVCVVDKVEFDKENV
ncbi:Alcohol dehydrogenase GroES-like domain-containing protein [Cladophialophora immunda]|nr:Alcohol dehydrogenase GroES-like domain-containing protein [Cladophialophora immunda]